MKQGKVVAMIKRAKSLIVLAWAVENGEFYAGEYADQQTLEGTT